MNRSLAVLGMVVVFGGPAQAGLTYRFSIVDDDPIRPGAAGIVWLAGDRVRIEIEEDHSPEALVRDVVVAPGDGRAFALHRGRQTYFEVSPADPFALPELRANMGEGSRGGRKVRDVKVELFGDFPPEKIDGLASRKHELQVSFTVETRYSNETLKQTYSSVVSVWTTDELDGQPALVDPRSFRTGYAEVDGRIEEIVATLPGFAVKQKRVTTTQYFGGPPISASRAVTLEGFADQEIPASHFVVPEGYRYHEPVLAGPGRTSPQRSSFD